MNQSIAALRIEFKAPAYAQEFLAEQNGLLRLLTVKGRGPPIPDVLVISIGGSFLVSYLVPLLGSNL